MQVDTEEILEISRHFGKLEDPRSHINRKHLLGDLIVICVCAVLSGCEGPIAIGQWAKAKTAWLKEHLELPHGIPSHDTIGRLLVALKPAAFQACFTAWIAALVKARESRLREETDDPSLVKHRHLAIDGKTLRGSHDHRKGLGALHLVSVWAVDCGVSLGQLATAEKSNEITAIPELLEQVQLKNSIVTIDAAGCQKEIAAKIVDGRGDYCLALKGNQGNLHAAVSGWIEEQMETDFADCRVETLERREKKHGREDHYTYYQFEGGGTTGTTAVEKAQDRGRGDPQQQTRRADDRRRALLHQFSSAQREAVRQIGAWTLGDREFSALVSRRHLSRG